MTSVRTGGQLVTRYTTGVSNFLATDFISSLKPNSAGILLIDKPTGMSSHGAVNWARIETGQKTVGHAGTLDPLATGLLIILVGRAFTKRQAEFLKLDKSYECEVLLGVSTDSYDSAGTVVRRASTAEMSGITRQAAEAVLANFCGDQLQKVPGYSAVKYKGKELYKLARVGKFKSEMAPTKQVHIFNLQLNSWQQDMKSGLFHASVSVHCSSGTYIRSLVHDWGEALGCGATVMELRRMQIGPLLVQNTLVCPILRTQSQVQRRFDRLNPELA